MKHSERRRKEIQRGSHTHDRQQQLEEFAMECIPARKRPLRYAKFDSMRDWALVQALANQLEGVGESNIGSCTLKDQDGCEYALLEEDRWTVTGAIPHEVLEDAVAIYCNRLLKSMPEDVARWAMKRRAFQLLAKHEGPKLLILC